MTPEASVWTFINDGGPWFWHMKSFAAFLAMFWLIRLAPSEKPGRAWARIAMIFGLFMISLSSTLNSGLGPLGEFVFFISFSVGSWLRMKQHVRAGIARPISGVELDIDRDWREHRTPAKHR